MDDFDVFTSKPSTTQENISDKVENNEEKKDNQQDDSSWIIENNPDTSKPADVPKEDDITSSSAAPNLFDAPTAVDTTSSSTTPNLFDAPTAVDTTSSSTPNLFEAPTAVDTTSSSSTPNLFEAPTAVDTTSSSTPNPFDAPTAVDSTSSQAPLTFNNDLFGNNDQVDAFPPTADEIISDNSSIKPSENKPAYDMFVNEELSPLYAINKKREQEIAAKDAEEKVKIEQLRQQAKADLERWYNERQRQMETRRQAMKDEENDLNAKALEKSSKESCDWSKVIRLVDFTDGTQLSKSKRDLTRMKSCIFSAKRINEKKKLANGV